MSQSVNHGIDSSFDIGNLKTEPSYSLCHEFVSRVGKKYCYGCINNFPSQEAHFGGCLDP
jgi:hypothetical protein